jgi:hypothetical protein
MQEMKKSIRTGAITLLMATALAAQQGTAGKTPDANPGFGRQIPNDAVESGGQPHSNSTYQKDRNGNQGFDLGWIGLFGLAGLFGVGRGRRSKEELPSHNA